jgi:hypothetical protein
VAKENRIVVNVPLYWGEKGNDSIYYQCDADSKPEVKYTVEDNIIKKIELLSWNEFEWRKNARRKADERMVLVLPALGKGVLIGDGAMGDLQDVVIVNLNEELRLDRSFIKNGGVVEIITKDENDMLLSEEVLIDGTIDPFECWKVFYIGQGLEPNSVKEGDGVQELVYGEVKDNDSHNMVACGENPNSGVRVIIDKSVHLEIDSSNRRVILVGEESQSE